MSFLEKFENRLVKARKLSRRSLLGRISRGCAMLTATLFGAKILDSAAVHAADTACCTLAFPNNFCPSGACPDGEQGYIWTCSTTTSDGRPQLWACKECYTSQCSDYYQIPI